MIFVQQVNEYKKISFKVKTYENIELRFNLCSRKLSIIFIFKRKSIEPFYHESITVY